MLRSYILHPSDDPTEQAEEGYSSYAVYVRERKVTVYHRTNRVVNKTGRLMSANQNRYTFSVRSFDAQGAPQIQMYQSSGFNGAVYNYTKDVLTWDEAAISGVECIESMIFDEVLKLFVRNGGEWKVSSDALNQTTFHKIAWILFPAVRFNLVSFFSWEMNPSLGIRSARGLKPVFNHNIKAYRALTATAAEEFVRKSFHPSWLETDQDLKKLNFVNEWWHFGNFDLGASLSKVEEHPKILELIAVKDDLWEFITHMVQATPVEQRLSLLEKCAELLDKPLNFEIEKRLRWQTLKTETNQYRSSLKKSLGAYMAETVVSSDQNLLQVTNESFADWYSHNILEQNRKNDVTETSIDKFFEECHTFFGWDAGTLFSMFCSVHPDYDLYEVSSQWRNATFSAFRGYLHEKSVLPNGLQFALGDTGIQISEARNYIVLSSSSLLTQLRVFVADIDDQLIRLGQPRTPLIRKLYTSLPEKMRNLKYTWKLINWGVNDMERVSAFKAAKITRKSEIVEMNELPDHLFYELVDSE